MSLNAQRLHALKIGLADLMDRPRNHPEWERRVVNLDWRLREWAEYLIERGM